MQLYVLYYHLEYWHTHLQVTQMSMLSDFGEPRHYYRFSFQAAKKRPKKRSFYKMKENQESQSRKLMMKIKSWLQLALLSTFVDTYKYMCIIRLDSGIWKSRDVVSVKSGNHTGCLFELYKYIVHRTCRIRIDNLYSCSDSSKSSDQTFVKTGTCISKSFFGNSPQNS